MCTFAAPLVLQAVLYGPATTVLALQAVLCMPALSLLGCSACLIARQTVPHVLELPLQHLPCGCAMRLYPCPAHMTVVSTTHCLQAARARMAQCSDCGVDVSPKIDVLQAPRAEKVLPGGAALIGLGVVTAIFAGWRCVPGRQSLGACRTCCIPAAWLSQSWLNLQHTVVSFRC